MNDCFSELTANIKIPLNKTEVSCCLSIMKINIRHLSPYGEFWSLRFCILLMVKMKAVIVIIDKRLNDVSKDKDK